LQKTGFNESLSESQDNNVDGTSLNLKAKLEEIISTSDMSMQRSNISTNYHQKQNVMHPNPPKKEPFRTLIFDTKDWF
jgi:hypothetical protein